MILVSRPDTIRAGPNPTIKDPKSVLGSNRHHSHRDPTPRTGYNLPMAQSPVIHALRDKRARLAGEIASIMKDVNGQRDALATLDAVILMFAPDCNPDMIPPIRPMG